MTNRQVILAALTLACSCSVSVLVSIAMAPKKQMFGQSFGTFTIETDDFEREGWFNPNYTWSMRGAQRYWTDRYIIGNREYQMRDLMGRKI